MLNTTRFVHLDDFEDIATWFCCGFDQVLIISERMVPWSVLNSD